MNDGQEDQETLISYFYFILPAVNPNLITGPQGNFIGGVKLYLTCLRV